MNFQHDGKILWSVSQGTNVKDELRDRRSLEEVSAERHLANENAFSGPPVYKRVWLCSKCAEKALIQQIVTMQSGQSLILKLTKLLR